MAGAYAIVRCGGDYDVVVAQRNDGQYYVARQYDPFGRPDYEFFPVESREARYYSSGQADNIGFGELPEEAFDTLDAAFEWVTAKRSEALQKLQLLFQNEDSQEH